MALAADLVGAKLDWLQSGYLGETVGTVAGAGTTQGAGTILFADIGAYTMIRGTTSGGATAFTTSSQMLVGKPYTFTNTSATTAVIFPFTGGAINGGSTNASISVTQNITVTLIRQTATAIVASISGTAGVFTTLAVSGNATVGGTLDVTGAATFTSIVGGDSSLGVAGQAAAQGGAVALVGGTSATSGNAGGAITLVGGTPGATGIGGAVTATGAVGGATSGAGGAVTFTGGAGTNGNSAGGAASLIGGAGQGTAAGGAVALTGGASGAGATGNGGSVTSTGGASLATDGNGGSVIAVGGALAGTGMQGSTIHRGKQNFVPQGAPTAKTVTSAITAAELATGIITTTGATAPSIHQLPTGTLLLAQFPGLAAGDSFDFSVINTGTGASDDATITVNTDVTIIGSPTVGALTDATIISGSGRFRARYTGGVTWIVYRLA